MGCFWSYDAHERMPQQWITLRELEQTCHTGDLLLFSGRGLTSYIISAGTYSPYSHIGMIVSTDRYGPCLWESSFPDGCVDILTGTDKSGPRLIRLRDKISTYPGVVHYRRLQVDPYFLERQRSMGLSEKLGAFMQRENLKNFEWNYLDMARSAHRWVPGEEPGGDESAFFCSELVAATWREMGYLNSQARASDLYTPAHFAQGNDVGLEFPIDSGGKRLITLGPTLVVRPTS